MHSIFFLFFVLFIFLFFYSSFSCYFRDIEGTGVRGWDFIQLWE